MAAKRAAPASGPRHEHSNLAAQHGLRRGAPVHHTNTEVGVRAKHPDGKRRDEHGRFARK